MKVFITGIDGVVGSSIGKLLSSDSYFEVFGMRRSDKDFKIPQVNYQLADLLDLTAIPTHTDTVIHTARVFSSKKNNSKSSEINIEGLKRLLNLSAKQKVRRFIYFSSTVVYSQIEDKAPKIFSEDLRPRLSNKADTYTKDKILSEAIIKKFCNENSIEYIILRLSVASGKSLVTGNSSITIDNLKQVEFIPFINLNLNLDMIHLKDIAEILKIILLKRDIGNETFNLTGEKINIKGQKRKLLNVELPESIEKFFPSSAWTFFRKDLDFDNKKLLKRINYALKYTSEESIFY